MSAEVLIFGCLALAFLLVIVDITDRNADRKDEETIRRLNELVAQEQALLRVFTKRRDSFLQKITKQKIAHLNQQINKIENRRKARHGNSKN